MAVMASVVWRCFCLCKRIPVLSKISFEINHKVTTTCRKYWYGSSVSFLRRISHGYGSNKQSFVVASTGFGVISAFRVLAFCYVDRDATNCESHFYSDSSFLSVSKLYQVQVMFEFDCQMRSNLGVVHFSPNLVGC